MQCAMPLVTGRFVLLTDFTTANIVLHLLGHFKLVEVSDDHFDGVIRNNMAGNLAVMFGFRYFYTESRII